MLPNENMIHIWFYLNRVLAGTSLNDEWTAYKNETSNQNTRLTRARDLRDAGLLASLLLGAQHAHVVAQAQVLVNDAYGRVQAQSGDFPYFEEVE